ncbi:Phosphate transport system permease protein pstA [Sebaldella termitidis]|jgi:phosphate transport system permease protein|uniref:Phosphate transport system permease protein PstA n=1 Tax=Sebaldella termitidis (strain ATCC 33386 / NCTC 11300) TaxID=526218 RepID=D1AGF8_SEBTE|nr:phosphate ABC transporter permease PstA [Sebaldella termitidis]ACZ10910.1 phosphate ABC transporter, inner membrane subunit PstA [Sebaldella termitidis ATCC 33386]MBP7978962.1 phosphate ABC transporter permease PstA [Sebaldella sp.]SUI26254.1 Phosphate transport system permease protein pstA [Sebaldella termitidis]
MMEKMAIDNLRIRKLKDKIFKYLFFSCIIFCIVFLVLLLFGIIKQGIRWMSFDFLTNFPSKIRPQRAGVYPALLGSLWLVGLVGLITIPVGVGAAIYLEEYSNKKSKLYNFLEVNISNLAGVPAIVYGLLGLALFSRLKGFRGSILAGAVTLSLMVLPVVIVSSREAIKAVPGILREAAYGLGLTRWQMIKAVVLPYASPGIFTGIILSLSRALGEAAPLLVVGAASYVTRIPNGIMSRYTALPIQIYQWSGMPKKEFQELAATGIIVLLVILLSANTLAIVLRNKYQKERGE